MDNMEEIIMHLIVDSGSARSKALEAVAAAEEGDFSEAEKKLDESGAYLVKAHNVQTELIQEELNGSQTPVNLLMIHAQDHLMNAITVKELSEKMVQMYRRLGD